MGLLSGYQTSIKELQDKHSVLVVRLQGEAAALKAEVRHRALLHAAGHCWGMGCCCVRLGGWLGGGWRRGGRVVAQPRACRGPAHTRAALCVGGAAAQAASLIVGACWQASGSTHRNSRRESHPWWVDASVMTRK